MNTGTWAQGHRKPSLGGDLPATEAQYWLPQAGPCEYGSRERWKSVSREEAPLGGGLHVPKQACNRRNPSHLIPLAQIQSLEKCSPKPGACISRPCSGDLAGPCLPLGVAGVLGGSLRFSARPGASLGTHPEIPDDWVSCSESPMSFIAWCSFHQHDAAARCPPPASAPCRGSSTVGEPVASVPSSAGLAELRLGCG